MGYEGDPGYEGLQASQTNFVYALDLNQTHRQNLFAKPANLHSQGYLHNPITYVTGSASKDFSSEIEYS